MNEDFYQFSYKQINGEEVSLNEFKGKVILIVNTASNCGLTYHYTGLEKLYQKYKDNGLVIIGFPCNQFGRQEPGSELEIKKFCSDNYNVTFPLHSKIEVNGANTHPLYKKIKKESGGSDKISWNFEKFLVNREGKLFKRFRSSLDPNQKEITKAIESLL